MNICFIGKTNVGKSSIINRMIGQDVSIVSEQPGTTTDAVVKRYEMNPVGAVTIYDTAGYDDDSILGPKRAYATMKVIYRSDLAVMVLDNSGMSATDTFYINKLEELKVPYIVVWNKSDLGYVSDDMQGIRHSVFSEDEALRAEIIRKIAALQANDRDIIKDLIEENGKIVLVMPIDSSAPKGRIILPQAQVLREILDINAMAFCCTHDKVQEVLDSLKESPDFVITDSQVIDLVSDVVPESINMTTFSILFARYRGELKPFMNGTKALAQLAENDDILIAEACSHHAMDADIGLVKIPKWLNGYLGFELKYTKVNGHDFPDDLEKYKLVVHCGGCMMNRMEMMRRIHECERRNVAITNYGLLISEIHGKLHRVVSCFSKGQNGGKE
jgi:[FeFe] hydrogenase H-cluster maturation GTPase HydF